MANINETFWQRIRHKYRLSVLHEETLTEMWHLKLSWLGAFTLVTLMFLLTVGLLSLLIVYTPIKRILPGYSEDLRQVLISETARVDSLNNEIELQKRYLDVIKQVTAGEVTTDTIGTMDSVQMISREQLLMAKQEATEEFVTEYERKEKGHLQLFDVQNTKPVYTLLCPAHGVILNHYMPEADQWGITIQTPMNENVMAVLTGTVVQVNHESDQTYSITVQHQQYLSIYRAVGRALKKKGDVVLAGESIGIASSELPLYMELWQNGQSVNPEEVIAF